jgi:DNA polymerase III alpha subunit/intein/homing endonuclease
MDIYTVYHLHDDTSNCNGYADSCSNFKEYIKLAKKQGMKSIAFSNHGGIYDWIKKKQECNKAGLKYIHGVELYLCNKLEDDDRGGHIGLYAMNYKGVLELNELISISTSKGILEDNSDRHMYYNPRISLEELMNTSENIIVVTACLASPLNRWNTEESKCQYNTLIDWLTSNKHRCFLEIQYHNSEDQIKYNKKLYELSIKTGIPLIAGTDTHSSNRYKAECRKILQIYKKSFYGNEDEFDLTWKTLSELKDAFKEQNSLPENIYIEAIDNTNKLADMVKDFDFDKTFKYPTLYGENVTQQWKELIYKKYSEKKKSGCLDLVNHTEKEYKDKIKEEFKVMCKLGMESFMMFMSELLEWCTENSIPYGFGRGSVAGSTIAFITDITDVDPVVWKTVFSRFCNEDRVSLGDIDVDFAPEDREKVYKYIIERFTPQKTAYIATFSTLQDRGCIDVLAGGLGYTDLDKVMYIKNQFDELYNAYSKIMQEEVNSEELVEDKILESSTVNFDNHSIYMSRINNKEAKTRAEKIKNSYDNLINSNQDLFYYLKGLKGTIVAKGTHPSGIIGSPITLSDSMGVFYKDGNLDMPVSTCAMKAVDSLNYVKFDILGLKTVGIIKDACKYACIPYPKSHQINWEDNKVWDNMIETQQGVFQFEGDYAFDLLKNFRPHTVNHMSMVNAALRPSGKSYRDRMIAGEFNKNPSDEIDKLLEDNNGYLIFQEDTIKFLTDICDFTGSSADTTRRCVEENSLILMSNGNYKKIKDIKLGDDVQSFNKFNISEYKKVLNVFNNGKKEVFKISTQHDYLIETTSNHKVLTQRGWINTDELTTDDFIMTPRKINAKTDGLLPQNRLSETDMFLIGLLVGDGTLGEKNRLHFTNHEKELVNKFEYCVNKRLRNDTDCEFTYSIQDGVTVDKIYSVYIKSKNYYDSVNALLTKLDLKHNASNKIIPDCIMSYPKGSKLLNLLAGLFNTDGGYNMQQSYIEYYSTSFLLVLQIKSLLHKYNIYSYICEKPVQKYNYSSYSLAIRQIDALNLFKEIIIPYMIGKKKDEFISIINDANSKDAKFNYLLPNECKEEILNMSKITDRSLLSVGNNIINNNKYGLEVHKTEFGISDCKAKDIIQYLYCPYTYELLFADYIPVRIKSIENVGYKNVYDIEVEENHNYVANNLIVHNCIGKKDEDGLKAILPKILEGYCNHSSKTREIAEEEAKQFVQIVADSSEYQFGFNHSTAYSMNGYECVNLRTYHTIEFIAAYLNRAENEEDTNNGINMARYFGISIKPIQFGKSLSEYAIERKTNSIYKGILSIKFCNSIIASELMELSKNKYISFIDLLTDINHKTSVDARQLKILTGLNFFSEFGHNKYLLKVTEAYDSIFSKKQINKKDLEKLGLAEYIMAKYSGKETECLYKELDNIGLLNEMCRSIENKPMSIIEHIKFEMEYLQYTTYTNPSVDSKYYVVLEFKTYKNPATPYVVLRNIKSGDEIKTKITSGKIFKESPFGQYSILKIYQFRDSFKKKKIGNDWVDTDEIEQVITEYETIKNS